MLERIIFPYLIVEKNPKRILDIGREDYQRFYNKFFFGRELWTIDRKRSRKEYGAERHIVGDVKNLNNYFKDDYFDIIIMNGVFGWGLDKPEDIERTFGAIYETLRPGGILVFGYNNVPDLKPVKIKEIENLKKFKGFYFKPLGGVSFTCINGQHTYNFYQKP